MKYIDLAIQAARAELELQKEYQLLELKVIDCLKDANINGIETTSMEGSKITVFSTGTDLITLNKDSGRPLEPEVRRAIVKHLLTEAPYRPNLKRS